MTVGCHRRALLAVAVRTQKMASAGYRTAAELDVKPHDLMLEGINMVLHKYGKTSIKEITGDVTTLVALWRSRESPGQRGPGPKC